MATLPRGTAVVRTWFGDDSAWESLVRAVDTPSEDGFLAGVVLVNDVTFEGLGVEGLQAAHRGGGHVSFLADQSTLSSAEHPILAVWLDPVPDDGRDYEPFRVVAAWLWSVENNINLSNMFWQEFSSEVHEDGAFRGW